MNDTSRYMKLIWLSTKNIYYFHLPFYWVATWYQCIIFSFRTFPASPEFPFFAFLNSNWYGGSKYTLINLQMQSIQTIQFFKVSKNGFYNSIFYHYLPLFQKGWFSNLKSKFKRGSYWFVVQSNFKLVRLFSVYDKVESFWWNLRYFHQTQTMKCYT